MRMRDRMYYTVQTLGRTRSVTPDGYLLCEAVPIARTGEQVYGEDEIELPGLNGMVRVERPESEVFKAETIASFEGKPITLEHPGDFVTPLNHRQHSVGHVQNVRRGEGVDSDLMLADLLITDPAAIKYANDELPEVSAGYDANYESVAPGRGIQRDIIGNHVAMVKRGRAGPRVSIKDGANSMAKKSIVDRLRALISDAERENDDPEEGRRASEDAEREQKMCDAVNRAVDAAMKARDEAAEKAKKEAEDAAAKTGDTVIEAEKPSKTFSVGKVWNGSLTGDAQREIAARAEVLVPGFKLPTADAELNAKDAGERVMRAALERAYGTDDGKECIEPFLLGRELGKLTGDALQGVFVGAAALRERANTTAAGRSLTAKRSTKDFGTRPATAADINAANRKAYEERHGRKS